MCIGQPGLDCQQDTENCTVSCKAQCWAEARSVHQTENSYSLRWDHFEEADECRISLLYSWTRKRQRAAGECSQSSPISQLGLAWLDQLCHYLTRTHWFRLWTQRPT